MTVRILVRPWAGFDGLWWATILPWRPGDKGPHNWPFRKPDWRDICFDCGAYETPAAALYFARAYCKNLGWRIRKVEREGKA